jgi:hypothetical protein
VSEATTPAAAEPSSAADTAAGEAGPPAATGPDRKRARRGAIIAGALTLPMVTLGAILLAVPLAVWYLSTVIRTLVVVVANIVSGTGAAKDANTTLDRIDPAALGGVTLGFAIVGLVFVAAGCVVSLIVLRTHRVDRPGYVTGFGVMVGLVIATVLTATVGALTGLIFGTARTVAQVLGNAALGIALTTIGAVAVTVATGIVVWLWMARLFRERDVPADATE